MTDTDWTPKLVAILTASWNAGHSAREIATALGGSVTRAAVIGKVHRLGLPMRNPASRGRHAPSGRATA